jgi:tetratricopeptide (TPR) repeat protein
MDIKKLLEEYDELAKAAGDSELEAWLQDKCSAFSSEHPDDYIGQSALYNELGSFYRARSSFEKGEAAFLKAKELLETQYACPIEIDASCATCSPCASCSRPYEESDFFGIGEPRTVTEILITDNRGTPDYATTLNNLAGLYRLKGEYQKALDMFTEARTIYEELGTAPADVYASCFNNMGLVYLDLKQPAEADECFSRAMEIIAPIENNDYIVGTTKSNMAFARMIGGDMKGAAEMMREAAGHFLASGDAGSRMYENCLSFAERLENSV